MEEKIIDKIKKLLKKADSAKEIGSLAEAELFANKANELLIEHNLTMHQIAMSQLEEDNPFVNYCYSEYVNYYETQAGGRWRMELIKVLCCHNLTGVIFGVTGSKKFRVYGEANNVEIVVWIYNYLSILLFNMCRDARKSDPASVLFCRHTYMKNYLSGAVDGIDAKLKEQKRASKHKEAINELILYNGEALQKFLSLNKNVESFKSKTIDLGYGYEKGYEAGKNVDLNRKLTTEQKIESKLLN